jgi:orotidine-5'-phosphate decarboxylase
MTFKEKWLEAVKAKNSVLCAGLDPAEFGMGRGDKGLPEFGIHALDEAKLIWCMDYLKAVAPFCAACKPNIQYFKGKGDIEILYQITNLAHQLDMVVIRDDKLGDIGETNDAGMFYVKESGADAVTYVPFPGNMQEAAKQGKKHGIGVISMCLMSNPEYEAEKKKWVDVEKIKDDFLQEDRVAFVFEGQSACHVPQYIHLARQASKFGLDGIVIGAPSGKNHIREDEIAKARAYAGDDMLVLLPGVGAQGGEASAIWKYFRPENVIVNVGRSLMLPKGSKSTPEEQAATAKQYMEMLNSLRNN